MRTLEIVVAMVVPVRVLKIVEAFTRPPGEPVTAAVTGSPDTWCPPFWIHPDRLGSEHPRRRNR